MAVLIFERGVFKRGKLRPRGRVCGMAPESVEAFPRRLPRFSVRFLASERFNSLHGARGVHRRRRRALNGGDGSVRHRLIDRPDGCRGILRTALEADAFFDELVRRSRLRVIAPVGPFAIDADGNVVAVGLPRFPAVKTEDEAARTARAEIKAVEGDALPFALPDFFFGAAGEFTHVDFLRLLGRCFLGH